MIYRNRGFSPFKAIGILSRPEKACTIANAFSSCIMHRVYFHLRSRSFLNTMLESFCQYFSKRRFAADSHLWRKRKKDYGKPTTNRFFTADPSSNSLSEHPQHRIGSKSTLFSAQSNSIKFEAGVVTAGSLVECRLRWWFKLGYL